MHMLSLRPPRPRLTEFFPNRQSRERESAAFVRGARTRRGIIAVLSLFRSKFNQSRRNGASRPALVIDTSGSITGPYLSPLFSLKESAPVDFPSNRRHSSKQNTACVGGVCAIIILLARLLSDIWMRGPLFSENKYLHVLHKDK